MLGESRYGKAHSKCVWNTNEVGYKMDLWFYHQLRSPFLYWMTWVTEWCTCTCTRDVCRCTYTIQFDRHCMSHCTHFVHDLALWLFRRSPKGGSQTQMRILLSNILLCCVKNNDWFHYQQNKMAYSDKTQRMHFVVAVHFCKSKRVFLRKETLPLTFVPQRHGLRCFPLFHKL
jgi:hypothetical protein